MIFKVFYQADKSRTPRRETTETLYLDLKVKTEKEGVIAARELLTAKTDYQVEFIEALSDEAFAYDQETAGVKVTKFK